MPQTAQRWTTCRPRCWRPDACRLPAARRRPMAASCDQRPLRASWAPYRGPGAHPVPRGGDGPPCPAAAVPLARPSPDHGTGMTPRPCRQERHLPAGSGAEPRRRGRGGGAPREPPRGSTTRPAAPAAPPVMPGGAGAARPARYHGAARGGPGVDRGALPPAGEVGRGAVPRAAPYVHGSAARRDAGVGRRLGWGRGAPCRCYGRSGRH